MNRPNIQPHADARERAFSSSAARIRQASGREESGVVDEFAQKRMSCRTVHRVLCLPGAGRRIVVHTASSHERYR